MEAILGVDVSSQSLDACVLNGEKTFAKAFPYTDKGCKSLVSWAKRYKAHRGVTEATGGYEAKICHLMIAEGLSVQIVNPAQVRHFAKGFGSKAKTDRIDAEMIARFAKIVPLPKPIKTSPVQLQIKQLVIRRLELKKILTAEKNRLRIADGIILKSLQASIAFIGSQVENLEKELEKLYQTDRELARKVAVLTKQKGIGMTTALALVGLVPELGHIDRKKITALLGLAPYAKDSGKFKGKRFISGGRAEARHSLYMPAWVATMFDPEIKAFYQKLIGKGKKPKVAITAVMRKLLVRLNATLRNFMQSEKNA